MMKLGRKQELFALQIPALILKAAELGNKYGFTVRPGDYFRDPRVHGKYGVKKGYGHARSCHKLKLAIDLNFIKDKKITAYFHNELGAWWEKQNKYNRHGGRFGDPNHYSMTHWGSM